MTQITFNEVPQAMSLLLAKMDIMEGMIKTLQTPTTPTIQTDTWFDIHELSRYLPDKPAITTIYTWVADRKVPFSKNGKKLVFLKYDIDQWLKSGRTATKAQEQEQLRAEALKHLDTLKAKK